MPIQGTILFNVLPGVAGDVRVGISNYWLTKNSSTNCYDLHITVNNFKADGATIDNLAVAATIN